MLFLSKAALRFAVDICREKRGYHAAIVPSDPSKLKEVRTYLIEFLSGEENIDSLVNRGNRLNVNFDNYSRLSVFLPSFQLKNRAYHIMIIDENIDDQMLVADLLEFEKLDHKAEVHMGEYGSKDVIQENDQD